MHLKLKTHIQRLSIVAMKKSLISFCVSLLLSIILSSCVKDVVLDAMEEPQLVVSCILRVDSIQNLQLSYTKGASRKEAPPVKGATAVLTDLTENREAGHFIQNDEGVWQLKYSPIPTHNYRLDVSVPDHDPVWAEQTMPIEPPVNCFYGDLQGEMYTWYNYTPKGIQYSSTFPCTVWAYAMNYNYHWERYEIVEEISTDYSNVDNFNLTGAVLDSALVQTLADPIWKLNLHYGSFLGGYPIHRRFLRFQKLESPTLSYFAIDGHFSGVYYNYEEGSPRNPSPTEGVLYFACLSDEYDKYLCEAFNRYHATLSSDLSSIYVRDNVYTNIHGGIGIFGAITTVPYRWQANIRQSAIWTIY